MIANHHNTQDIQIRQARKQIRATRKAWRLQEIPYPRLIAVQTANRNAIECAKSEREWSQP